ncbi:HDOD domain-containing protein [Crenobacter luteus]|uniref:Histidine kinase n=1 Tax=Crenobacter luteus TaxID=1452487 RepID=A0A165G3Z0_9NEIS|nr:histidine kinase [Crenobacter luteus]KZE35054.1 histidine kinase [Crenobacter luteus]
MELADWFSTIAARRWPVLPGTQVELSQLVARHPDLIHFSDLANLCLSDPLLLFDLLRAVGPSAALRRPEGTPTVEQMLMLIGLEASTRRLGPLPPLWPVKGRLDMATFEAAGDWLGRGRVAALIAKEWLSIANEHKVEDVFLAALVYNLPACLYLVERNHVPDAPLLSAVSAEFGVDYPKLLLRFCDAFSLPAGLAALFGAGAGQDAKRRQLLRLAVATANGLAQGWWRPQFLAGIDAAARLIGSDFATLHAAVAHAALSVARHPRAPGYTFPARDLALSPGAPSPAPREVAALSTEADLDAALREAIRTLANELKFDRVLFWQAVAGQPALRLRYQVGLSAEHPLRRVELERAPGGFFELLCARPQSFHAPADARAQLAVRYADPFFLAGEPVEFAVMTVFSGDTLVGLFYVDNAVSGRPIDDDRYRRFKTLIAQLARHA